jgi:DNA-binding NtrC family response regulator
MAHAFQQATQKMQKKTRSPARPARELSIAKLDAHVRDAIARGELQADSTGLSLATLGQRIQSRASAKAPPPLDQIAQWITTLRVSGSKLEAVADAVVRRALAEAEGNKSAAARLLGMDRKAYERALRRTTR